MARTATPSETFVDLHFPACGIDRSRGFNRQPNREAMGQYARTTPDAQNVRAFDPITNRMRGGQRPSLARYINAQVSGSNLIQHLAQISGVGYTAPGGGVQSSQSGRVVTLVAVSQGTIKVCDAGGTAWVTPTNGTTALITSGVIMSAVNIQRMYFADGTNRKYYDPSTNTVSAWTASAGSLPVGSDGGTPRGISTWRGRTVEWGLIKNPQAVFMSRVGDPSNWDYSPPSPSAIQAVAFTDGQKGLVGDVVNAFVPYSDDWALIGTDHQLHILRGDPADGGNLDRLSDAIGMVWGDGWCKGPDGAIYFVSNRMDVYQLEPGSKPQPISGPIKQLLATVNTGSNTIRLVWDERFEGLHVFCTRTAAVGTAIHLFWEFRSGAWWKDVFANNNHNPLACCVFDGNTATDRVALIGSWDGFVRFLDPAATTDDGTAIESRVAIVMLLTKNMDDVMLKSLKAVLGEESGDVEFAVYVADTAEKVVADMEYDKGRIAGFRRVTSGTWSAGLNLTTHVRQSGYAVGVLITATSPWAMEVIKSKIRIRMRA